MPATIMTEHELDFPDPDDPFGDPLTSGTLDYLIFGDNSMMVVDIKTGRARNHAPQMMLYSLMAMHHFEKRECTAVLVYADLQLLKISRYTYDDCYEFFWKLRESAKCAEPSPCEYCAWCEHQEDCPALIDRVTAVAKAQAWELADYTPGAMTTADELGRAYDLACQMEKWAAAVKAHVAG